MRRRKNSYRVLSVLMALVMLFLTPVYSVSDVEAASKRSGAIQIPYSFKNLNGNNKAFAKTNYIWVAMGTGYSQQKYSTKNIKVSATVYVPKKVVSKENSAFYVDFMGVVDPETYGDTSNQKLLTSKYLAGIWNNGEKISMFAKDEKSRKDVKKAKFMSVKSGKGTHANEYIITIKNMPLSYVYGDNNKLKNIQASDNYFRGIILDVYGENNKASGKLFVDKVQVKASGKMICNYNFDSQNGLPHDCNVYRNNRRLQKAKIVWL